MKASGKIVMAGCTLPGYELINFLLESGLKISYFVTITEKKAAQLQVSNYADFRPLAAKYGIPVYEAEKYSLKSEADRNFFREHKFDLLVQGGWQRLFPGEILETLSVGAVGVHGSSEYLPKGRGRSPINWSLIEGKKRFILHFFIIKPGIDDGDVFHHEIFGINEWDDCNTLYYKNIILSRQVLMKQIPLLLAGEYKVIPQEGGPSYYPKRTPEDGLIDWTKNVFRIYDFIRAQTKPFPGAFTFLDGKKISIWKAQPFDTRIKYTDAGAGEVTEVFLNGEFIVNCEGGLLLVTDYEGENLKICAGKILGK